jgi:hypothetical protein
MSYRRGHRTGLKGGSGRPTARAGLALAGLVLTVAGCGHVLPLGLSAIPVPSHLAAAIVLQPGFPAPATRSAAAPGTRPPSAVSCPAGYAALPAGDEPPGSAGCFRKLGTPVTFTSAAATVYRQPAGRHGQPAQYVLRITVPAAGATALTAITTKVAGTKDALAIMIAGQAWAVVDTLKPLTNGEFGIPVQSLSQALQLQRILLQPA